MELAKREFDCTGDAVRRGVDVDARMKDRAISYTTAV